MAINVSLFFALATLFVLIAALAVLWTRLSQALGSTGGFWARLRLTADIVLTMGLAATIVVFFAKTKSEGSGIAYPNGGHGTGLPTSAGVDNVYHWGAGYSSWANDGAKAAFVIEAANGLSDYAAVRAERNDALSAVSNGVPVYVEMCAYPNTTQPDVNTMIDSLSQGSSGYQYDQGFIKDLNYFNQPLDILFDMEQSAACGDWESLSLSAAKTQIQNIASWARSRAQADGYNVSLFGTSFFMAWGGSPGINAGSNYQQNVPQLAGWLLTNPIPNQGNSFSAPQLFGYSPVFVRSQQEYNNEIATYWAAGVPLQWDFPLQEDGSSCTIASQNDIDIMVNEYTAATGATGENFWYDINCPWPVP